MTVTIQISITIGRTISQRVVISHIDDHLIDLLLMKLVTISHVIYNYFLAFVLF